jgi:hypothetical protein
MPSITELPAPLNTFYEAFEKGDLDTLRSLYLAEAKLRDPGIGFLVGAKDLVAEGVDAIARYYYQAFSNMPEAPVVKLHRFWQQASDVIVEYSEGMMTYLEVFTLQDGKIAAQQVFWGSVPPAPLLQARRS